MKKIRGGSGKKSEGEKSAPRQVEISEDEKNERLRKSLNSPGAGCGVGAEWGAAGGCQLANSVCFLEFGGFRILGILAMGFATFPCGVVFVSPHCLI